MELKASETKSLADRIAANWKKSLTELPVQKDFPRLAGGLEIVNGNTNYLIYKENISTHRAISCRDILWILAVLFPDESDQQVFVKQRRELKQAKKQTKQRRYHDDDHEEQDILELDDTERDMDETNDFTQTTTTDGEDTSSPAEISFKYSANRELPDAEDEQDLPRDCDIQMPSKRKLLNTAHNQFESSLFANNLMNHYSRNIRDFEGDLSVQMEKFFVASKLNPKGRLVAILKCIQQEIICPAVMELRTKVYSHFRYKDVKGTWTIKILLYFDDHVHLADSRTESIVSSPSTGRRRRRKSSLLRSTQGHACAESSSKETSTGTNKKSPRRKKSLGMSMKLEPEPEPKEENIVISVKT